MGVSEHLLYRLSLISLGLPFSLILNYEVRRSTFVVLEYYYVRPITRSSLGDEMLRSYSIRGIALFNNEKPQSLGPYPFFRICPTIGPRFIKLVRDSMVLDKDNSSFTQFHQEWIIASLVAILGGLIHSLLVRFRLRSVLQRLDYPLPTAEINNRTDGNE